MENLKLPELPPLLNENFVTLPTEQLNQIVKHINSQTEIINLQSDVINNLLQTVAENTNDISTIANILEELYEKT